MGARNDGAVTAAGNSVAFLKRKAPALFQRMKQLEVVLENASLFDHFMLVGRLKQIEELHGTFKTVHSELEKLDCDEIGSELADDFEELFVTLNGIILLEITKRSTSVTPHPAYGHGITPAPFQVDSCAILEPIGLTDRNQYQSKHPFLVPALHGGAGDEESYSKLEGGLDCINTGGLASDVVPAQPTTSFTDLQALWVLCKRFVPADVHPNEPTLSAGGRNSGHRAGPQAVLGQRPFRHWPIGGRAEIANPSVISGNHADLDTSLPVLGLNALFFFASSYSAAEHHMTWLNFNRLDVGQRVAFLQRIYRYRRKEERPHQQQALSAEPCMLLKEVC